MLIEKAEGPYWVARYQGVEFLGYSIYEAMCRCIENICKYSKQ